jgi:8-oxo-dGTP pyrophosphatase MutT (NUDIX family)
MTIFPQRELTCGLIIVSPAGWLLGHTTLTPYWDLPKGQRNPEEDPLDAALRECEEETGLDLRAWKEDFIPLGTAPYNRKWGKTLALFQINLPAHFDLGTCQCGTWVEGRSNVPVLDMDDFAWVAPDQIQTLVKPRMAKHLRKRGLLG